MVGVGLVLAEGVTSGVFVGPVVGPVVGAVGGLLGHGVAVGTHDHVAGSGTLGLLGRLLAHDVHHDPCSGAPEHDGILYTFARE